MKQEFYCIAAKNQIMGIDTGNGFELFFEEPSIMNLGDLIVFRDKKGAEHILRYYKENCPNEKTILNHAEVKKLVLDISLEEI